MPRFHFDIDNGSSAVDRDGTVLSDWHEADEVSLVLSWSDFAIAASLAVPLDDMAEKRPASEARGAATHLRPRNEKSYMVVQAPRFTVTTKLGRTKRTETRTTASSTMVLADRMAFDGYRDIRILDPLGVAHERTAFRLTLPLVARLGLSAPEA